jgi:amino acid adenylation domain-containing protein
MRSAESNGFSMNVTSQRRDALSSAKRALLDKRLKGETSGSPEVFRIRPRKSCAPAPLSFPQQRLWFLDQLMPGNVVFNEVTSIEYDVAVSADVLQRSLNEIVRRHESLRTSFRVVDGEPRQIVAPFQELTLTVVDLTHLSEPARKGKAIRLVDAEARQSFDLANGPLLRACLLKLGKTDFVFVLTMHHIICDEWSMNIFWDELNTVWSAFEEGLPSPLLELPVQYSDFANWQRERLEKLEKGILKDQIAYWKEKLAGLSLLELPTDRPRPPVQSFRGVRHWIRIPASLVSALKAVGQGEGATLFMTLLAVFQSLLHRYSGQKDVVVGTYIAGRNHSDLEKLIGFFLNTLVIRTDFGGNPRFRELLRRVREVALEAYANQDVPFEKLVEELQPQRDLARSPLCQVIFQLLNVSPAGEQPSDPGTSSMKIERGGTAFDLTCTLWESRHGLNGFFEYNSDLFDASTVASMAEHYENLLISIAADAGQRIGELPLIREVERRRLLREWNATGRRYRELHESVSQLFEQQAKASPEATALIIEGRSVTYEELYRRANRLGNELWLLGVRREVVVGVCLDRSVEAVVALMGVWKAGGAYLPLDPGQPIERLVYMVEDAQAAVVVSERKSAGKLSGIGCPVLYLGEECERQQDGERTENREEERSETGQLAYVIYTSGSTGRPKGVAVEQEQVLNRLSWMWEAYPFQAGEVCCQRTALSFVDSLWEMLGGLLRGMPTVVVSERQGQDVEELVEVLRDNGVTRLWVVPSLLKALLETGKDLTRELPKLRFWVSSGEALGLELWKRFKRELPLARLHNLYGTSEVWDVTWHEEKGAERECVPIGRPIANMQVYVLDAHMEPVPKGWPGELYVGGLGVGRGYLGRPDLTAERFVPDPYSRSAGSRLYRTRDLVRYREDGELEYLGRRDRQVKVRGYRIEVGEIEHVLASYEEIEQAAVVAQADRQGDLRLVAYVVWRDKTRDWAEGNALLRRYLQGHLPEYMIPSLCVFLDRLPLTISGKVDHLALPSPELMVPAPASSSLPENETERELTEIWSEILGIEDIGRDSNFFELGGHSLLATRLVSRVRDSFGIELQLRSVFEGPTVAQLAQLVHESEVEAKRPPAESIIPLPREHYQITSSDSEAKASEKMFKVRMTRRPTTIPPREKAGD